MKRSEQDEAEHELHHAQLTITRLEHVLKTIHKEAFLTTSSPTQGILVERVKMIERLAHNALEALKESRQ